ncbi:hypothetical protein MMON_58670 [Mycolicibacterium monacense]|uniref:Uncharacterized protein n=1 Tax=Mycolicibacterium monacense TaxID=85693 RepID=A0AAD1N2V2_MYCMB|nr:hypothetical protein MMON_58670 [Mycolicibacterium monacense]
MVVDVEFGHCDGDLRIPLRQFGFEFVETVDAAGAQRQVTPLAANARAIPAPSPELAPVIRIL